MKKSTEYIAVGGQALMEGIMMRGPKGTAVSLRLPDGTIETTMKDFVSIRKKNKFFNIPLIRGVVSFVESMILGYNLLMESAEKTSLDFDAEESESKLDRWITEHFGKKMMAALGFISAFLGIALSFFLFVWLPSFAFDKINVLFFHESLTMFRAIFEGIARVIIFVFYMWVVSKMKEIHRVYMYHGAEHKTIFCFEHGKELTVDNIRPESRFHPRCGTSFIFVTLILSILISCVAAFLFPDVTKVRALWIAIKILIMPVIMGIGFEFIQLAGKYPNKCTRALSAPGLLMQRITTAEPDDAIIEVAIEAMKAALSGEVSVKSDDISDAESGISNEESENAISGDDSTAGV
ncbi:MAG: DUF1385 domain-containing protein [Clostridiales bacterium]|nr:DUF1385 domain-containing protein [Clostridiales bacterium]